MKVLVTGSQGYIGEVMVRVLHKAGHAVTGLDTGFYATSSLYDDGPSPGSIVRKDTRAVCGRSSGVRRRRPSGRTLQ